MSSWLAKAERIVEAAAEKERAEYHTMPETKQRMAEIERAHVWGRIAIALAYADNTDAARHEAMGALAEERGVSLDDEALPGVDDLNRTCNTCDSPHELDACLCCSALSCDECGVDHEPGRVCADCEAVSRREGERYRPVGRGVAA